MVSIFKSWILRVPLLAGALLMAPACPEDTPDHRDPNRTPAPTIPSTP